MLVRQFVSKGLAHYSYLVGSGKEAAVIDPRRDCLDYLALARKNGMRIKAIFETHRNEDFVSGALELSKLAEASVYHGRGEPIRYGEGASEGDSFGIGDLSLRVIETPGHTPASISLALLGGGEHACRAVFTGDALFAGEVGRVDFLGPEKAREMAGMLHDSLHRKLLPLGDEAAVHPAHGKGSFCGGGIGAKLSTTIGDERAGNPLLALDRKAFVERKASERLAFPPYFKRMEELNSGGPPPQSAIPEIARMDAGQVESAMAGGAQAVDARSASEFAVGHIPGSLSIGRDMMSPLAGWTLDASKPVVLIDGRGEGQDESARRLLRVGIDRLAGYLEGGFQDWSWSERPVGRFKAYSPASLAKRLESGGARLVDVRPAPSFSEGRIRGAERAHFAYPEKTLRSPGHEEIIAYCASGVTASLCLSILRRKGWGDAGILIGGFEAWTGAGMPVER